jgi:hypothetical protein
MATHVKLVRPAVTRERNMRLRTALEYSEIECEACNLPKVRAVHCLLTAREKVTRDMRSAPKRASRPLMAFRMPENRKAPDFLT